MLLVTFSKVSKDYGGNPIFREVDLEIQEGERIGLVGHEEPSSGSISRRRNLTIGYLGQEADPEQSHKTVFEAVSEATQELVALPELLSALEARMADPEVYENEEEMSRVLEEYGHAQERFEVLGGYTMEHRVEEVLQGLGFGPAW